MSHAEAWQTTSRSRGRVISERCQKVSGSGARPSEVKKASPVFTILIGIVLLRDEDLVEVVARVGGGGATMS